MNKKGFTLVELVTTFALTTVVIILLLNVAVTIKEVYSKSSVKSQLYIDQANLSNQINSKIKHLNLDSYEECTEGDFCYTFNLVSGESINLVISNKIIKFGNFVYTLDDKTTVKDPNVYIHYINTSDVLSDSFLVIRIPIFNDLYPTIDFGINSVYRF